MFINPIFGLAVGLVRTVVSISHCGCDDPGSIPGLDIFISINKPHLVLFICVILSAKEERSRDVILGY